MEIRPLSSQISSHPCAGAHITFRLEKSILSTQRNFFARASREVHSIYTTKNFARASREVHSIYTKNPEPRKSHKCRSCTFRSTASASPKERKCVQVCSCTFRSTAMESPVCSQGRCARKVTHSGQPHFGLCRDPCAAFWPQLVAAGLHGEEVTAQLLHCKMSR